MKKEHISDALNMLNDDIIEETNNVRTNAKPKRKWVKWGVVAACLCLAVTIAIPVLHHKGGPDTQDPVQNIAALEYNGKFYEAVKLPEVLEKYGLPPEITADMAGEHISYLKSDGGIGYKSTVSQTDIELYRYAPAVCDGVYVLRDGDTWYAALFCNFYQFDSNTNCSFTELYRVQTEVFDGIPEENQQEAHTAFADDRRNLRIETASGLRFFISFYPNYDWIEGGGTMSYFKIDKQMHGWIERNLNR